MRKVIDSNFLQAPELTVYLSKSPENKVVLTDKVAMEAYKGDTLKSIYKSMAIVSDYPSQVVILKGTRLICGLRGHTKGLQSRLIDTTQTRKFGTYCRKLREAQQGHGDYQRYLLHLGKTATDHINQLQIEASQIASGVIEFGNTYSQEELRILRVSASLPVTVIEKMIKHILLLADAVFSQHPDVKDMPADITLFNTYIFRYALCMYLLSIRWITQGGVSDVKPINLANDVIDMNVVAYATFFDSLLSKDKKALSLYAEANYLLQKVVSKYPAND